MTKKKSSIYGYLRIEESTPLDSPLSIESQLALLTSYAEKEGKSVTSWFIDRGYSGSISLSERDRGKALLQELKKGDWLLAASFDRLFENAADALEVLEELQQAGVVLHVLDLGGELNRESMKKLETVLSAVATKKNIDVGKKIKAAKARLREQGKHQGGKVPFGYKVDKDGNLIEDKLQQECIKIMERKREEGLSYRAISEHLESTKKVKISYNGIRKILQEERKTT